MSFKVVCGIFLFFFISQSVEASRESIIVSPALGNIGNDIAFHNALTNISAIKRYENKPFYNFTGQPKF